MVRAGESGKAAVVGGVGRLSRNRVSRSALSVVGGLLALRGFLYVLCSSLLYGFLLWNSTTNKDIFGFCNRFVKICREAVVELAIRGQAELSTLENGSQRAQGNQESNESNNSEQEIMAYGI